MTPADEFVGRSADLEALRTAFAEGARLVTVWGPAGIGKTRLAEEHASRCAEPVSFCRLARIETAEGLVSEVARMLGSPGSRDVAEVGRMIAARGAHVVVLDNFEQLATEAHGVLADWLSASPRARFLVTTRERLRVRGEAAHELPPLGVPRGDGIEGSDAATLFVARARARDRTFAMSGHDARCIAEIVRRLDGIPLAIELAAARVDVLGVAGLLERLDSPLAVLGGAWRGSDPRQATLRGAIEWSLRLLDDVEQRAFAECAVMRGPFAMDAAEAVLGGPEDGASVLDRLQSLRDKSLLARAGEGSEVRLVMLHSIRELARERFEALRGSEAVRDRHARWFAARAEADLSLHERSDVLAAIDHMLGKGDVAGAGRALVAAEGDLSVTGPQEDVLARLDRLVSEAELTAEVRARLLAARGRALQLSGSLDDARRSLEEAVGRAAETGDRSLEAEIVTDLGVLFHQMRDTQRARTCYTRAIALERGSVDASTQARLLANLGALHHDCREWDDAREHYEAALELLGGDGDSRLAGITLTNCAVLAQERGELASAAEMYDRAVAILERSGAPRLAAIARTNLGALHHERDQLEAAIAAHRQALGGLRRVGDVRSEALCLARLGAALACSGDLAGARSALDGATQLVEATTDVVSRGAVRVFHAFSTLAEAERAQRDDDEQATQELLARFRSEIAFAHAEDGPDEPSLAERSDDVRLALRLLADASARLLVDARPGGGEDALLVAEDARWFRAPGHDWEDLRRHAVLRRILLALLEQRRVAPGKGLSVEALVRAAWPGERIRPDAAANRVYVSVAKLRRRGLSDCLIRNEEGYLLTETVPVRRADAPDKVG